MQALDIYIEKNTGTIFVILLILAIPAFFTNLGILALFADESTRANVALEMILSQNFSVPTIGGEFYYNKPPFYNWILAGVYLLTGSFSEFTTRLPAIIPLFLFTITIYYSVAYFLKDKRIALLSGVFFMVNSRMLLYDSMLGHIDIFYSWLTFISFMCIFYFYQKRKWFLLFFISYLITAITFLCKGMPAIVFQGFTIITLLSYSGNLKRLFSWQHIFSGIVCLLIIGLYFLNYSQYNNNLEAYFSTIWDQSSQRTAGRAGVLTTVKHVLLFPIEHLVHLLPASFLLIFCFNRRFLSGIWQNDFLKFISLVFLANIWIYWLSPLTRPRYLLMLYPLLFIVWTHSYYTYREDFPRFQKIINNLLLFLGIIITLAVPSAFFFGLQDIVQFLVLKVCVVFILCGFFTWLIFKSQNQKFIPFVALLLCVRLGFSWFILPHRAANNDNNYYKYSSIEMGKISGSQPFYFYQYHPHVLSIPFHDRLIFYIERTRLSKVKFTEDDSKPGYYLTFDRDLNNPDAELLKTYKSNLKLFKVQ